MKKAILFSIIMIIILLFLVQLSEDTKTIFTAMSKTPDKLGPIAFGITENTEVPEDDAARYSVYLSIPGEEPTPEPIPTPTPAPAPDPRELENLPYKIIVDVSKQIVSIMTSDEDGHYSVVYKQFLCSTGLPGTPTVTGNFSVKKKRPWLESYPSTTVTGEAYQVYARYRTTIYQDYHFHSILYQNKRDFTSLLRTSFYNLGRRASHGCIRLSTRDAKWLYTNCDIGTPISIKSSGGPALDEDALAPLPFYRDLPRGVYYDPTDIAKIERILDLMN